MIFGRRKLGAVLQRLTAIEDRLGHIETAIDELHHTGDLRAALDAREEQIESLSTQGLHVIELLDQARRDLRRRDKDGA